MDGRAAIVGVGLATPLGASLPRTWDALLAGRYITDHGRVPVECEASHGRAIPLALRVAHEAIGKAGWHDAILGDDSTALVVGTSKGPVESWLTPLLYMEPSTYVIGGLNPTGLGEIAARIATDLHMTGPRMTLSAACASGLDALIRAVIMIRAGEAKRIVVVGVESSLHPLFIGSFSRLGVLPRPDVGCRPFDMTRDGFLMSEAAAAVCLERPEEDGKRQNGEHRLVVVDRFAFGGDATHLTGSDPDGQTLRRLVATVMAGRPIDLVHAHATGTGADAIELAAVESCLTGFSVPPVLYSHKGALGHSLGAAAMVSVVLSWMMHQRCIVPGNVRTRQPMQTTRAILSPEPVRREIMRSLAIASGFGGAMAAVELETI